MVHAASDSDALTFEGSETAAASSFDAPHDNDYSKPFRGILIGLVIVTPLWLVIGLALYFLI